jgi:hypothetical protein
LTLLLNVVSKRSSLSTSERISDMQFVDKGLARRFESAEEMPQVLYARAFQKTRPEIGASEEQSAAGT